MDLVHGMSKSLTPGNSSSNIALVFRDLVQLVRISMNQQINLHRFKAFH